MKFKLWAQDHSVIGLDYTISDLKGEYERIGYVLIGEIDIPVDDAETRKKIAQASGEAKAKKKADLLRQLEELDSDQEEAA